MDGFVVQLLKEVLEEDLEQAVTALRSGEPAPALANIERAIAKLNSALSAADAEEPQHHSAGPITF